MDLKDMQAFYSSLSPKEKEDFKNGEFSLLSKLGRPKYPENRRTRTQKAYRYREQLIN